MKVILKRTMTADQDSIWIDEKIHCGNCGAELILDESVEEKNEFKFKFACHCYRMETKMHVNMSEYYLSSDGVTITLNGNPEMVDLFKKIVENKVNEEEWVIT